MSGRSSISVQGSLTFSSFFDKLFAETTAGDFFFYVGPIHPVTSNLFVQRNISLSGELIRTFCRSCVLITKNYWASSVSNFANCSNCVKGSVVGFTL